MDVEIKPSKYYHPREVAVILGCCKSNIYKLMEHDKYPLPYVDRQSKLTTDRNRTCRMVKGSALKKWMSERLASLKFDTIAEPTKWYSAAEAANILGVHRVKIYVFARSKNNPLHGEIREGEYGMKFLGAELIRFKKPKSGRPRIYPLDMPMSIRPCVIRARRKKMENRKKLDK